MTAAEGLFRSVVVDTGPLVAYVDRADAHHERCLTFLTAHLGTLVIPQLVIAEVTYFLGKLGARAELAFLADVTEGQFSTEPVHPVDWPRITELVSRYRGFPLGTTDASVIACAERLDVTAVATLDHRHFGAVRPRHVETFALLP